ncbi:MAG: PepSY domain-containing protein, partial [Thermoanaerobaculia bacterium]
MRLRAVFVTTHRWMGLIAATLWLLQAATGVFAVFHWEIDDAITAGAHRATDFKAIERKVSALAPHSLWSTAGAADRYDVYAEGRVIRIDGAGNVLRVRREDE